MRPAAPLLSPRLRLIKFLDCTHIKRAELCLPRRQSLLLCYIFPSRKIPHDIGFSYMDGRIIYWRVLELRVVAADWRHAWWHQMPFSLFIAFATAFHICSMIMRITRASELPQQHGSPYSLTRYALHAAQKIDEWWRPRLFFHGYVLIYFCQEASSSQCASLTSPYLPQQSLIPPRLSPSPHGLPQPPPASSKYSSVTSLRLHVMIIRPRFEMPIFDAITYWYTGWDAAAGHAQHVTTMPSHRRMCRASINA